MPPRASTARKGSCNILVVGQTGVGKSSLINYIIGEPRAAVGVGHPVTSKDDISSYRTTFLDAEIILFDSWGIETDKAKDWKKRIRELISSCNGKCADKGVSWFHTILYCISSGNSRVQDLDLSMIRFFKSEGYSVVIVLTKADQGEERDIAAMMKALPSNIPKIPVSSGGKDRYGTIDGYGKEELLFAIVLEAVANLPKRLSILSQSLISGWSKQMNIDLEFQEIGWFDNSGINGWINGEANRFLKKLNVELSDFTAREFFILNALIPNSSRESGTRIYVYPPSPDISVWEIALGVILLPWVIGYGIIRGRDIEKEKLQSLIAQAAKEIQTSANDYIKNVGIQLEGIDKKFAKKKRELQKQLLACLKTELVSKQS